MSEFTYRLTLRIFRGAAVTKDTLCIKLLRLFVCSYDLLSYVLLENLHLELTHLSQVSRLSEELLKSKRQLGRTEERLAEAQ